MSWTTIHCKQENNGVAWVTLCRPKERNAMSALMFEELNQLLTQLEADNAIRAVVLTGEGKAFCAGGDLTEMKAGYGGNAGFYHHMESANRCAAALFPTIPPAWHSAWHPHRLF